MPDEKSPEDALFMRVSGLLGKHFGAEATTAIQLASPMNPSILKCWATMCPQMCPHGHED